MAAVTAQMVKDLRERTDLPMMECKQALTECQGDVEAALEWLRKKHKGKMAERSGRATGEGRIGIHVDEHSRVGAIIELQCETASVAQNELFINLAQLIARRVAGQTEAEPDSQQILKDTEVDAAFTETFGKLREAMNLKVCRRIEGSCVASYVHHDGKSGVLLSLSAVPQSDLNIGADLCMHALFTQPLAIDRSGVSSEQIEKVRADAIEIAKSEGKPDNIVAKIAEGKVNAFFAERVLMEQLHVKTDDYGKAKVGDILKKAGVDAVTHLTIMRVGG
jgi:elongation factor Ts